MKNGQKPQIKILIVDDVEVNRYVLRDIVTEMGHQPLLAESGEQALKIVEHIIPQLIISDISMPVMDGFELCERLKKDPKTREIPVIFISALEDTGEVVKGFEVGGEDYIAKPFVRDIVKARVGLHLKLYETKREVSETNRLLQISVQKQLKQLETEKKNVLYALTRVARENAAYDAQHMERLCFNCRMLAEALQLTVEYGSVISDGFIDTLELAAPLCDLGNVAVSADVLQKEGELTEEEIEVMRTHTTIGSRIISDVQRVGEYNEFLQMSYDIALYHHEYYDGSGYPNRVKGDAIPLAAQIVAVVSDFCALTEERTYRGAYSTNAALAIMKERSESRYNPKIARVLAMIVRQLH